MQPIEQLEDSARALLKAVFRSVEEGEMGRDYTMLQAIERPILSLIASLAQAGAASDSWYARRSLGAAKSSIAEIRALIRAAREVGYLGEGGEGITNKIEVVEHGIRNWTQDLAVARD